MAYFAGWQKYLNLAAESTWNTTPSNPAYIFVPYTTYDVFAKPESIQAALYTGLRQRRHNRVLRQKVNGQLVCPLWGYQTAGVQPSSVSGGPGTAKSIAQWLIDWCLNQPASISLDSFLAETNEAGADNKRHNGLRVQSMTIAGAAEQGEITISLTLEGALETGGITPQALSVSNPQPVEFLFSDSTFSIGGVSASLRSFSITVTNQLQVHHVNSQWPSIISAGVREVAYEFTLFKTDNTYDALRRSIANNNQTAQLILKGLHLGSAAGNYTTVQFDFARINFANATEQGGLNDLAQQQANYIALKPDSATNELQVTYGTSA